MTKICKVKGLVNKAMKKLREITERKSVRKPKATTGTKTKLVAPPGGNSSGPGKGSVASDAYEA